MKTLIFFKKLSLKHQILWVIRQLYFSSKKENKRPMWSEYFSIWKWRNFKPRFRGTAGFPQAEGKRKETFRKVREVNISTTMEMGKKDPQYEEIFLRTIQEQPSGWWTVETRLCGGFSTLLLISSQCSEDNYTAPIVVAKIKSHNAKACAACRH